MHSLVKIIASLLMLICVSFITQAAAKPSQTVQNSQAVSHLDVPVIDLSSAKWGEGESFALDGMWHAYWGALLTPDTVEQAEHLPVLFPVPETWDSPRGLAEPFPDLGYLTYRVKVKVPEAQQTLYLYLPDMPSAYRLWVNGEFVAANGTVGRVEQHEKPAFLPQTARIEGHSGELELLLQVSNYHYREGGIWFSPRISDESGRFALSQRPMIIAVFFSAVLIALGLYNFSLYLFRRQEHAALYFGLLCLVVGFRRLLIDERAFYLFELFEWSSLQAMEHLCFYLTLPLFVGFFASLFQTHVPAALRRVCWLVSFPFFVLCLVFPARVYTEFNVMFQLIVTTAMVVVCLLFIKVVRENGKHVMGFGFSLLLLAITVINDVLKANDFIDSPNIAHFGVLAFAITQSLALQRQYLKNLAKVESMTQRLEQRNADLVEMDAFKDDFLATTSHELRTPLYGISGLARLLLDSSEGQFSLEQRKQLSLIASTTKRLSLLVNDILDHASIKHGKLRLNLVKCDIAALSQMVLDTLQPVVGEKPLVLHADVANDVRYLMVDEYRFQQILFNLIGNAVKYTESGEVNLRVYKRAEAIVAEVADTGPGISKEQFEHLFRPFEQGVVESGQQVSGTGLGLSISRQLVELHGGTLDLDSHVGEGTCVRMVFPESLCAKGSDTPANPTTFKGREEKAVLNLDFLKQEAGYIERKPSEGDSPSPLIFVVDDEPINREVISGQLRQAGYRVEVFEDGLAFLSKLNVDLPDLVLLDYMMPRMNGPEVCESVRRTFDSYELPIMMLTAKQQVGDIVKALGAGANDYLIKPYHEHELLARVASQIATRQYWIANRENQKLKNEIERRGAIEAELADLNTRLLSMLDASEDMMLLINNNLRVVYANEQANEMLTSSSREGLLGKTIYELVNEELASEVAGVLDKSPEKVISLREPAQVSGSSWQVSVRCLSLSGRTNLAMVFSAKSSSASGEHTEVISELTRELGQSRQQIALIESVLKKLELDNKALIANSAEAVPVEEEPKNHAMQLNKEHIVALHRCTLNLWERYTGKTKTELAEESRCWRVYIDGTTVKTRTFDKYLSLKTVPDKPRWRAVVRTANHVLAHCELSERDRQHLTELTGQVEFSYS